MTPAQAKEWTATVQNAYSICSLFINSKIAQALMLDERECEVLRMKWQEKMTAKQIAKELNVSGSTVHTVYHKVLDKLENRIPWLGEEFYKKEYDIMYKPVVPDTKFILHVGFDTCAFDARFSVLNPPTVPMEGEMIEFHWEDFIEDKDVLRLIMDYTHEGVFLVRVDKRVFFKDKVVMHITLHEEHSYNEYFKPR